MTIWSRFCADFVMTQVMLFGAPYSVYVRIARLVLEEAGVSYELSEVDIFADEGVPADYLERHPEALIKGKGSSNY